MTDNKFGFVPESKSDDDFGFVEDEAATKSAVKKEFETPLEKLKTGVEGFARGGTFGLSDVAETKLGISTPERIQKRREVNPVLSNVTEAGGMIGTSILAPETSIAGLLEKGAAKAAASLAENKIAKAALHEAIQGAGIATGNVISEASLSDHELTAEQILSQVGIGTVLGGALGGGSAFASLGAKALSRQYEKQLPDLLNKAAGPLAKAASFVTKHPEEDLLKLFKNLKKSTTTDSEARGIVETLTNNAMDIDKAANSLIKSANEIHPQRLDKLLAEEHGQFATQEQKQLGVDVLGKMKAAYEELSADPAQFGDTGLQRRLGVVIRDFEAKLPTLRTPQDFHVAIYNAREKLDAKLFRKGMKTVADEDTSELVSNVRRDLKEALSNQEVFGVAGKRQGEFATAQSQLIRAKKTFLEEFGIIDIDAAGNKKRIVDQNKFQRFYDGLDKTSNIQTKRAGVFENYIDKLKKMTKLAQETHAEMNVEAAPITDDLRSAFFPKEEAETLSLRNMRKRLAKPVGESESGSNLFDVGIAGALGVGGLGKYIPGLGVARMAKNAIDKPVNTAMTLSMILQARQKAAKAFNGAVDHIIEGRPADLMRIGAVDFGTRGDLLKEENNEKSDELFKKRIGELSDLQSDEKRFQDVLGQSTRGFGNTNENVRLATQMKLQKTINYLNATAPKDPTQGSIIKEEWKPTPTEVSQWNRRLATVQEPYEAFKNPTKEGLETLQVVWPKEWQRMQEAVMQRVGLEKNLSYRAKIRIQDMFKVRLDRTSPAMAASYQQNFDLAQQAKNEQDEEKADSTGKGSMKNLNVAADSETSVQKIQKKFS